MINIIFPKARKAKTFGDLELGAFFTINGVNESALYMKIAPYRVYGDNLHWNAVWVESASLKCLPNDLLIKEYSGDLRLVEKA